MDLLQDGQGCCRSAVDGMALELGLAPATVRRAVDGCRHREEELVHALMGRLWEAAEYPSQAFEPAWHRWVTERGEVARAVQLADEAGGAVAHAAADRAQELHEIVLAVADELCRTRPEPVDLTDARTPLGLSA